MSGYTDDDVMGRGVLDGRTAFLQKPFTATQFATKVRDVLDQPRRAGSTNYRRAGRVAELSLQKLKSVRTS